MKQKRIRLYSRAAIVLLMMLLTTQTAWAWSGSGTSGNPYLITTSADWTTFCTLLANNDKGYFTGKTVKLNGDITISSMAGASKHDFTGTFDGGGHTLTFNYTTDAENAAPFQYVEDATIKDLHVAGTVQTSNKYAAGFIAQQYGTVTISNCRSSVTIKSSTNGDGTHGGFVAVNNTSASLTIQGCVFDGKLLTTNGTTKCGGFVGYSKNSVTITNSRYAPAALGNGETESTSSSATFVRGGSPTITNCYYTRTLGTAQGTQDGEPDFLTRANNGNGTSANPYKITSADDLKDLSIYVNGTGTYKNGLPAGVAHNCSDVYFQQNNPITLTSAWTPIGTSSAAPFKGHYDGGNNAISGLTVSGNYKYAGLFGYISSEMEHGSYKSTELTNINIVDCNINVGSVTDSKAGGISGETGPVHLSGCRVSGSITGYGYACGLVGIANQSYGVSVSNCFADVTVTGTSNQYNEYIIPHVNLMTTVQSGTPSASGNYYHDRGGNVTAGCSATPLYTVSGVPSGVTLATTNATLTYNDTPYFANGATTTLTVDDANGVFNTFSVSGATYSVASNKKSATITFGSSDVTVTATLQIGGVIGNGVTWSMSDTDSNGTYDRLTLSDSGTLSTSPWATDFAASITRVDINSTDIAISGNPFSTLGSGAIIVVPTPAYAVSYASAAFASKLRVQFGSYLFTATNEGGSAAYAITSADDLNNLAAAVNAGNDGCGKTFRQTINITYSHKADNEEGADTENNYTSIGNNTRSFNGTFDGQGHTISGIRIYKEDYNQGLFGNTGGGAVIRGITLADARITAGVFIGGIIGYSHVGGSVSDCHVAADVFFQSHSSEVGGLMGFNAGTISNCTSAATIIASNGCCGGIAGRNFGIVSNCTSTATVTTGGMYCGGIVGQNDSGTLRHNLAIGAVVSAARDNSHGAICGRNENDGTLLENNYYYGCKVASNNVTATGVGYSNTDVTTNYGAVPVFLVTLNDGVTIQTAMAADLGFSYGGKNYWFTGTELTLVLPDLPTDVPAGYLRYAYTANGKVLSGTTLTVGNQDITVKRTLIVDPAVGKRLTLATNGDGTVAVDECAGVTDNGDGTYAVLSGTTITVKATPAADSYFKNWNTETDINSNVAVTSTFTVTDNMTLTANFVAKPVLTLTADGNGTVDIQGFTYGSKTIISSSSITLLEVCSSNQDEGGDKLFDGIYTGNNKWCTVADPKFVEFKTSSAVQVNGYTLITGNDNSSNPGRNPKSWVLKARNNVSDNWTTIASVTNDNTMMDVDYTPYDFQMDVTGSYKYFRFEVSAVHNNDNILQLGELQLFYQEITPVEGVTKGATANTYILDYGTAITVKAMPAEGKCVRNWDNDDPIIPAKAATLTKTYTLKENTTATAHFASYHTLTPGADLTVNGLPVSQGSTITVPTGATVVLTHNHVGYTAHYTVNTTAIDGSTFTMPDENVTVGATWTMTTYTITYELNGGDVATANPTTYNVETETFTLNNPTKPGYTFTGWTGSNGTTPETTVTITKGSMTEDLNYTANFEFIRFTEGALSYEWTSATSVRVTACNQSATSVTIPATVSNLGVTYNVTAIGNQAFYGRTSLESVSIPASVTSIGGDAFNGCTSLESVTIPTSVTSIRENAFCGCTGLTSIEIPASVTSIWGNSFNGCAGLQSISVADGNTKYHSEGNCIIETARHKLIQGCKNSVIPTNVTRIGDAAFAGCTSLESITIPASVTTIEDNAFDGCTGLTSIEIPASMMSIDGYAFDGCTGLTSVTIYAPSLYTYGTKAFRDNASGRKIYVFENCMDTYKAKASMMSVDANDIEAITGINLKDNADNSSLVAAADGNELNVTLQGRTLTKDNWNTLCLPFDLSCAQIESTFGSGTQVKTLSDYSNDGTTVTITYEDAAEIEAGKPYIVKPTASVVNPVFTDVTISNTMNDVTVGGATFKGTYGPVALTANDKQKLFLANNTLWYPTADLTVRTCRAYFELDADVPETAGAPSIVIEYGEATSLTPAPSPTGEGSGYWFTLDGRKLDKKPTTKGMYIHNGHKVVIK